MLAGAVAMVWGIATAAPALAATVPATVIDNAYQPQTITVAVGDVVVWTNTGQRQHTVTADNGSFNSGPMTSGQTFSQTFNTPGTFAYFCAFHGGPGGQGQAGTITVTAAQATTSTTAAPAAAATTTTAAPSPATTAPPAPGGATATTLAPAAGQQTTTTRAPTTATTVAATSTPLARTGSSWTLSLALFGAGLVLIGVGAVGGARARSS